MNVPTIHAEYGGSPPRPVRFEGERDELQPGAFLGFSARPELMRAGDIITGVSTPGRGCAYYYDPRLYIEGDSFVRLASYAGSAGAGWQWVNRR